MSTERQKLFEKRLLDAVDGVDGLARDLKEYSRELDYLHAAVKRHGFDNTQHIYLDDTCGICGQYGPDDIRNETKCAGKNNG